MKTPATSAPPSPCEGRTLVLGVSGSIAAYKACELVREFSTRGADVHVMLTAHACEFVTAMTFQTLSRNPVTVGLFDQIEEWQPGHISLSERADVLCIAPATANIIAKLAHGVADDALSTTALAFAGPLVIAPAMNTRMYQHPATVDNMATLRARGALVVEAEEGELACGTVGPGRLAALPAIVTAVEQALPGARPASP
jgi:phosphopantothenoylcysteine decarboxylase/phosphopantothenate--cysteine ligase